MKQRTIGNRFSRRYLIGSKWTAVSPINCDKHFVVTGWADSPKDCDNTPDCVTLEAITTGRKRIILWRALRKTSLWRTGWR